MGFYYVPRKRGRMGGGNGLRYLRWGGDGEAVRANKANGLIIFETLTLPQRQVDALLARMI